jgi:hypothetical protein
MMMMESMTTRGTMMTRVRMTLTMLNYLMMMMESMTTRGTMMKRGRMTLTMLNYLNDDDGKHDH